MVDEFFASVVALSTSNLNTMQLQHNPFFSESSTPFIIICAEEGQVEEEVIRSVLSEACAKFF
jgi:hypothetical protein